MPEGATSRLAGYVLCGGRGEHAGGGSTNAVKGRRLFHLSISRAQYSAKWHGRIAGYAVLISTLGAELPIRWLHAILTRAPQEERSVRQAMALVCKEVGSRTCRMGGVPERCLRFSS